jgi:cytochrome c oxidase subunit 4
MSSSAEDVRKSVKLYIGVLIALAVLTALTVFVASWKLGLVAAIAIALVIASIKGSLVASVFMHLVHEKSVIFIILALTFFFFIFLLLWPVMTSNHDLIHGVVPMEVKDKFADAHHGGGHGESGAAHGDAKAKADHESAGAGHQESGGDTH